MVPSEQTSKTNFKVFTNKSCDDTLSCMHELTTFIESVRHTILGCAYGL